MNDMPENERQEMARLQRMLEEVTASDRARPAPNDPEVAGLREAWLAFGRLLEAADQAQSENWNPESIQQKEPLRKQAARHNRHLTVTTTAAAALIIALGLGWWLRHDGRPKGHGLPDVVSAPHKDVQPQPLKNNVPVPAVVNNEASKTQQATTSNSAASATAWDDTIDTQIASVSQEIESVRQTWQHRVDDADMVQYRIDEVSEGMLNNAL
jgi:hypothetical protein